MQEVTAEGSDGVVITLAPFMPRERGAMTNRNYNGRLRYRLQGQNIEFLPVRVPFTATLFYTPAATRLEVLSDSIDGINGFEMAAIYGTIACLQAKEESDPTFYEGRKAAIYRQIDALASERDASMPERVQDVMSDYGDEDCW